MHANLTDALAAVEQHLSRCADWCEQTGAAEWLYGLGDEMPTTVVRYDAGWLRFSMNLVRDDADGARSSDHFSADDFSVDDFSVDGAPSLEPRQIAGCNGSAPAGVKFCVAPRTRQWMLVADIPLGSALAIIDKKIVDKKIIDEEVTAARIASACAAMPTAYASFAADLPVANDDSVASNGGVIDGELDEVATQSGWRLRRRATGEVLFPLDLRTDTVHAQLFATAAGAALRTSPLPLVDHAMSAEASCWLLLQCGFAVRMARPSIGPDGYHWEAVWAGIPSVDELRHALSAVSIAVRTTKSEAEALADEAIAESYLRCINVAAVAEAFP